VRRHLFAPVKLPISIASVAAAVGYCGFDWNYPVRYRSG
jgi:hypothetical protein